MLKGKAKSFSILEHDSHYFGVGMKSEMNLDNFILYISVWFTYIWIVC